MSIAGTVSPPAHRAPLGPVAIIGLLFFIMGFFTWINGPLIAFVKLAFDLDDVNAFLVPMAFYLSYFFLALPSSAVLRRTGMKNGMALGLLVMALGATAFGRHGPFDADVRREATQGDVHTHAPSGTRSRCCTSPQLAPVGSTLPGFITPSGSKARRRRF